MLNASCYCCDPVQFNKQVNQITLKGWYWMSKWKLTDIYFQVKLEPWRQCYQKNIAKCVKSCLKMIDFNTFKNCLRMLGDLGKLIVDKGFKKLPKVQKIAQSGHSALAFHVPSLFLAFHKHNSLLLGRYEPSSPRLSFLARLDPMASIVAEIL